MRFPFDQSADFRLIRHLEGLGHDVQAISREHPAGIPDQQVITIAVREQRILVTADLDFGDLVIKGGMAHAGILLIRLPGMSLTTKIARLDHVLAAYADQLSQFVVVTERAIRVRRSDESADT